MPDPMSKSDVEDVLASIRRLVTDDKRVVEHDVQQPPTSDRLVLTPSLRVPEDEFDAEVETEEYDDGGATWEFKSSLGVGGDDEQEDVGRDLPETSETDPQISPLILDKGLIVAEDEPELVDDDPIANEPLTGSDHTDDNEQASDTLDEACATEDESQFGQYQATVPENATSVSEDGDMIEAAATDVEPLQPQSGEIVEKMLDGTDLVEDMEAEEPENKPHDSSLSAKIAKLETLVAGRNDQWEPDDAGTDAYAGTEQATMQWEDATEVPEPAEQTSAHESAVGDADSDVDSAVAFDDVMDEAALRELVSDIVREELQGALGERITRNVRKLVRREIHRALAAQELE